MIVPVMRGAQPAIEVVNLRVDFLSLPALDIAKTSLDTETNE